MAIGIRKPVRGRLCRFSVPLLLDPRVDTHKPTHAAVAITGLGARVAELTIKVGRHGYRQLETWAEVLGTLWHRRHRLVWRRSRPRPSRRRLHRPRGQPSRPPAAAPTRQDRSF